MPIDLVSKLPLNRLDVRKSCADVQAIDTISMPNSLLQPDQTDRLIDLLVDESRLLNNVRVIRVNNCKGNIHKVDLCETVTEGACTTSCPTKTVPQEGMVSWATEKYRAVFDITSDFLECNIERGRARDTFLNQFTKAMRNDMETAAIQGDDDVATGDNVAKINNLLGVNDGWAKMLYEQVPTCQIIDAGCASPSKYLYYEMKRRIPTRYRSGISEYRWVVPPSAVDHQQLEWTNRETNRGDAALAGGSVPGPWGIPMFEVPLMPEDIPCGTASDEGFQVWLTPLQNLILVIGREFTTEVERVPRLDRWQVTVHYKADFVVENPDLVVMATNVTMCNPPYVECSCQGPCPPCPA